MTVTNERWGKVVEFWFSGIDDDGRVPAEQLQKWWQKNVNFDALIKSNFLHDVELAAKGNCQDWLAKPKSTMALILLLDQFPRHIYRHSAQAYAMDNNAVQVVQEGLSLGHDKALPPIMRSFFYMPLEHSEELAIQNQCVELFKVLSKDVPVADEALYKGYIDYAVDHQKIIQQFGRFPHRNVFLQRQSTPEEEAYLADPDSVTF